MGSGRTETARILCGIDQPTRGQILVRGNPVGRLDPRTAIERGVALVPEDRIEQGLVLQHSIADNVVLPVLDTVTGGNGLVNQQRVTQIVGELVDRLRIKASSVHAPTSSLSGGNQQKVVIAKWLASDPDVFVLDEPTAGIDIGSKAEIVQLVRHLADQGKGVVLISSELPELLALSDRILVLDDGQMRHEVSREQIEAWMPDDAPAEERLAHAEHGLQRLMQKETTGV